MIQFDKNLFCIAIASGQSISDACADFFITEQDFYSALYSDESFFEEYKTARAFQQHKIVDDLSALEQKVLDGVIDVNVANYVFKSATWRAARLNPDLYGKKVEQPAPRREGELTADMFKTYEINYLTLPGEENDQQQPTH